MINENPNFNQTAQWMLITLIRAGSITRTEDTITPLLKMNHQKGQVALLQSGVIFKSDASETQVAGPPQRQVVSLYQPHPSHDAMASWAAMVKLHGIDDPLGARRCMPPSWSAAF